MMTINQSLNKRILNKKIPMPLLCRATPPPDLEECLKKYRLSGSKKYKEVSKRLD